MNTGNNKREIRGPLKKHPYNSRYFSDDGIRAVYLTGSHTWANLQDILVPGTKEEILDFDSYLDALEAYGHNFSKLWMFENAAWAPWTVDKITFSPLPFSRTGTGTALDGLPKFNLDMWNEEYFMKLRERAIKAGKRGIYVSVMLFQGFSINKPAILGGGKSWDSHPFNKSNNVNGVNGEIENTDGLDSYSLKIPSVTAYQEAYVRKVIDTVNDLDNILYEIVNETDSTEDTCRWQYRMINCIKEYEALLPKQHPVGMTIPWDGINAQNNKELYDGPADWISPFASENEDYRLNPPSGNGRKVIITDTDHLWGHGGSGGWVWKSFLRGLNPIFMDTWLPLPGKPVNYNFVVADMNRWDYPAWEPIRVNMGYTLKFAEKINLSEMSPCGGLATSGYCLAHPGHEYLVYLHDCSKVKIKLYDEKLTYRVEWFDPGSNTVIDGGKADYFGLCEFISPFGNDSVLYLSTE